MIEVNVRREVIHTITLPRPRGAPARLSLRILANKRAPLAKVKLHAYRVSSDTWEPLAIRAELEERSTQAAEVELVLESPADWIDGAGRIRVRQRFVRPPAESDAPSVAPVDASVEWQLDG